MTATQKFIATIAVLFVLGLGAYMWVNRAQAPTTTGGQTTATTTNATSTTPDTNTDGKATLQTPDYKKPIVFSATVSADTRTQLNAELKTVQTNLEKNLLDIKSWVDLGTLHKMGGDYANAALYWEFVTSIYSGKSAPYYSLGDLYSTYLINYPKAEADYKLAIKADDQNVNAYAGLYTMYHYSLHDDTKAAAILVDGLKANPQNNYLLGLQKELK